MTTPVRNAMIGGGEGAFVGPIHWTAAARNRRVLGLAG